MKLPEQLKVNEQYRKYIEIGIAVVCIILGVVLMFIPFIPLGYLLIIGGAILLTSKIPQLKMLINKLKNKDNKGRVERAEKGIKGAEEKIVRRIIKNNRKRKGSRK